MTNVQGTGQTLGAVPCDCDLFWAGDYMRIRGHVSSWEMFSGLRKSKHEHGLNKVHTGVTKISPLSVLTTVAQQIKWSLKRD